jgi:hypothetical protein
MLSRFRAVVIVVMMSPTRVGGRRNKNCQQ